MVLQALVQALILAILVRASIAMHLGGLI